MPIDSNSMIQEVVNRIVEIWNYMVPITLPGETELTLGTWALIVSACLGLLALIRRLIPK